MRSDVSSRRRRRGGDMVEAEVGEVGGEAIDVGSWSVGGCCGKGGGVVMPESRRTASSWSCGGRIKESHSRTLGCISRGKCVKSGHMYLRSSGVAPSTFLLTSSIRLDNRSSEMSSLGFRGPKTSLTAGSTRPIVSLHPLCNSHQLKVRYLRLVSKSLP